MKKLSLLFILLFVCVGCDQGTKYTAKHFLEGRQTLSYMGDIFRLSYAENSGGFLSLGAGLPETIRLTLFVFLASIFLVGFLFFVIRDQKLNSLAVSSGALIIGGGLGNLMDRILNHGAVIDFMNIGIGSIRTGIFNGADLAILAGIFIFAVLYVKKRHNQAKATDP
ncbi:MAG: signal peptidase II [Deltaproteobacteria bacterium]|nr:signal peptidase II [Deltaproteobacteria bacterium]